MAKEQKKGKPGVAVFEIAADKETFEVLEKTSRELARCLNWWFREWFMHHCDAGTPRKIEEASVEYRRRKEEQKNEKKKNQNADLNRNGLGISPAEVFPYSIMKRCLERQTFGGLKVNFITFALNMYIKTLRGKSAIIAMPRWWAIFSNIESLPSVGASTTFHFPGHGSSKGMSLSKPEDGHDWLMDVVYPFKSDYGKKLTVRLLTRKEKMKRQVVHLHRLVDGTYEPMGCSIYQKDRKWFVAVGYRRPLVESTKVDDSKVAYLAPGKDCPWMLKISGEDFVRDRFASNGEFFAHQRERLVSEERSRVAGMRFHGEGSMGHGRNRATVGLNGPKKKWHGIVKHFNEAVATKIFEICQRNGVGKLIYLRPDPDSELDKDLYLSSAGAGNSERWIGYEWYRIGRLLANRCHGLIGFEDVKTQKPKTEDELRLM